MHGVLLGKGIIRGREGGRGSKSAIGFCFFVLTPPLGPHSRFGDTLSLIPSNVSQKRDCGTKRVNNSGTNLLTIKSQAHAGVGSRSGFVARDVTGGQTGHV
ncbi:unnamed protein product, partial [Laminaria digitata]